MAATPDSIPIRTSSGSASPNGQAGANRAQRVVLVHLRHSEDRHHGIADEFLGPAPERKQLLRGRVEELPEHLARPLRV